MLRIVTTDTTIALSGRLGGPWVAELLRAFEQVEGSPVVVDVSDVSFVAADGVDALRALIGRGAVLRGCPAYLWPQLAMEGR